MSIEPTVSGWNSIKSKLIAVIRIANKIANARIQRSGAQDSISFSGDSMVINLKQFPDAPTAGAGAGGLSGIEIIWADKTETFVAASDMLSSYDPDTDSYWSLVLTVSSGVFDKTLTYDATQAIFEDDGGTPPVQTKYRFRLITQGGGENVPISAYGQYREVTTCVNGEPFQRLTKVT